MAGVDNNIWIYYVFAFITTVLLCLLSATYHNRIVDAGHQVINRKLHLVLIFLLWLEVVLFCAFRTISRGYGGTDAIAYKSFFENAIGGFNDYVNKYKDFEVLYLLTNWIVHKFTDNYQIYLVLYYTVMVGCLLKFCKMFKLNKYYYLGTLCLVFVLLQSFNLQRNILAVFLSFFVIDNIKNKQYLKAGIQIIILMGIHRSSVILFVPLFGIWLIEKIKGKKTYLIVLYDIVVSSVILLGSSLIGTLFMGTRYSAYDVGTGSVALANVISLVFVLIIIRLRQTIIFMNKKLAFLIYFYILFIPLIALQSVFSIAYRMVLYTLPISYVLFSKIKEEFSLNKNYVNILINLMANAYLLYRVLSLALGSETHIGSVYMSDLF